MGIYVWRTENLSDLRHITASGLYTEEIGNIGRYLRMIRRKRTPSYQTEKRTGWQNFEVYGWMQCIKRLMLKDAEKNKVMKINEQALKEACSMNQKGHFISSHQKKYAIKLS